MAPSAMPRKHAPQKTKDSLRSIKKKQHADDHSKLVKSVEELDPKNAEINAFTDLPLSHATTSGLEASHFKQPTDIQKKAIPLAFKGHDILGAAKTGSGKTLAFLIPVLENLYRQRWTELDGLGALIISPTRELAIQIFEVLRKVGRYHTFSAGLVIGGRSLQEERERLGRMNILVCTPGRMLQHMDQTAAFDVDNLQMLVLDEADRILDMGFQTAVDAILEHLPKERQTMLFSATQTRKVSDLARLSLKEPEYVAVHEASTSATPAKLQQHYIVTPLPQKLDTLFSFIKANLKAKILVFMSSGKQVRFVFESFRHLQPGIPLLHLHGRQNQTARLDITQKFATSKNACLFATDVVARGLDFPSVDWVIQLDCPEDADTYIHRVGRTARYEKEGRAVLFLDPSEEEGMLKRLESKNVPIHKINVRQKKQLSVKNQLQNMCFQDPELKYIGQKAFISYTKSVYLQKDKEIFDISKLDLEAYASSLGLPGAPKIRFQKGDDAKKLKNTPHALLRSEGDDSDEDSKANSKTEVRTKYDRMFERQNQDVLSSHYSKIISEGADQGKEDDEDQDFLSVKRVHAVKESDESSDEETDGVAVSAPKAKIIEGLGEEPIIIDSKRREKLLKSKKQVAKLKGKGTKLVYDEDGNAHAIYELTNEDDFRNAGAADEQRAKFVEAEAARVQEADVEDKELVKQKRREKKLKRKEREAAERSEAAGGPALEGNVEDEDPLALMRSLPLDDEEDEEAENNKISKKEKKTRKWFEDDSDNEDDKRTQKRHKVSFEEAEPETLEDLEALATGLLA